MKRNAKRHEEIKISRAVGPWSKGDMLKCYMNFTPRPSSPKNCNCDIGRESVRNLINLWVARWEGERYGMSYRLQFFHNYSVIVYYCECIYVNCRFIFYLKQDLPYMVLQTTRRVQKVGVSDKYSNNYILTYWSRFI